MTIPPWQDPKAEPLVRFDGVTKRFGQFTAVDDISLTVYEGEFFALLGPSGCGKTTLMRMLAGFETPSTGLISLAGNQLNDLPPNRRPVNMMFQSYALFPHLNVADNIAFGLKRDGLAKGAIEARVQEMLKLVQLEAFARRKPDQLSGGQKQRVALARALAKKPKLLLLDEPLGALDKKLRQATQFELVNIQETLGTTFMIVTHDQEEAMTMASRIAVMDAGKLIQVATPRDIYEYPQSRYVAEFIGEINIIQARNLTFNAGLAELSWADGQAPLVAAATDAPAYKGQAWLAVRPEKIDISKTQPAPEANLNAVAGTVEDIGYIGHLTTYHVRLADGRLLKAQDTNSRQAEDRGISWEDEVWLQWHSNDGVLLYA